MQGPAPKKRQDSEFVDWLRKGVLVGVAVMLALPLLSLKKSRDAQQQAQQQPPVATAPQQPPATPAPARPAPPGVRLADFRDEVPSADARLVANWVVHTANHKRHAFVLVDKKDARVYVFGPEGRLQESAPALLGAARGDDTFPGVGDKPLSAVRPEEKTTPAGRFVAEPGMNADNEDVVWVDYDAAVSMHRIRPLVARERRLERLATLTTDDNRISFGCINLPVTFYENVLNPTVHKYGAVVYVLPETRSPQQVFGAYDVTDPAQLTAAAQAAAVQKVALRQAPPAQPAP
jgi:hypothetical protein